MECLNIRELFSGLYKVCECSPECKVLIPFLHTGGRPAKFRRDHRAKGDKNPNWKGGRTKIHDYWYIHIPNYYCADKRGYVSEHVYFYSEYNKLCMLKWGEVHHIKPVTEDYCNNMIWNLEGMMKRDHDRLHMIGNKKNLKDFSGRFCSNCGSTTTYIRENGRPKWKGDGRGGWVCSKYKCIKSITF